MTGSRMLSSSSETLRVLVCGSRDWTNYDAVVSALTDLPGEHQPITIVHGDARGADHDGMGVDPGCPRVGADAPDPKATRPQQPGNDSDVPGGDRSLRGRVCDDGQAGAGGRVMNNRFKPLRVKPNGYRADCGYCWLEGPDHFGNYDLIENDRCPIHGAGQEKTGELRRGAFGRMLKRSKEDRDAA